MGHYFLNIQQVCSNDQNQISIWVKIHVMRDNPNHGTSMMGGMWGARLDPPLRSNFKESIQLVFEIHGILTIL